MSDESETKKDIHIDVEERMDAADTQDRELSEEDVEQIKKERDERLDPDNRPEGAIVDNTGDNAPDEDALSDDENEDD